MRKLLFAFGFISALLAGCDVESSDNGDMDGFWVLERVDSLSNNAICDYSDHHISWSFQYKLLQLSNGYDKTIICQFEKGNDRLSLKDPCIFDRTWGDTPVTDVEVLKPYGINSINENFKVKNLNSGDMILESSVLRLYLKKH
jgi:hypothetical protein